jgi:hypothetical protein
MNKPDNTYTIKTIAIALQASRDTVRKYFKTEEFKSMIEVQENRVNRFSFVLLVPFEEFESAFKERKASELKKSIVNALSKNPKNRDKPTIS